MHAALHSRLPPHNAGSHPTRRAAPLPSVPFVRAHRYINQRQTQTAEVRGQRSRRRQAHRTERGLCKPAPLGGKMETGTPSRLQPVRCSRPSPPPLPPANASVPPCYTPPPARSGSAAAAHPGSPASPRTSQAPPASVPPCLAPPRPHSPSHRLLERRRLRLGDSEEGKDGGREGGGGGRETRGNRSLGPTQPGRTSRLPRPETPSGPRSCLGGARPQPPPPAPLDAPTGLGVGAVVQPSSPRSALHRLPLPHLPRGPSASWAALGLSSLRVIITARWCSVHGVLGIV